MIALIRLKYFPTRVSGQQAHGPGSIPTSKIQEKQNNKLYELVLPITLPCTKRGTFMSTRTW